MRQRGAMYEINAQIWPALYGYTGWLWGSVYGWPVTATLAAVALGLAVGAAKMSIHPYGMEMMAVPAALVLPWFLDTQTWRWTAVALCVLPLPRLIWGLTRRSPRD